MWMDATSRTIYEHMFPFQVALVSNKTIDELMCF